MSTCVRFFSSLISLRSLYNKTSSFFIPEQCDAVSYILEGRLSSSSSWTLIGSGDLPWKDVATARNARGQTITDSTYDAVDPAYETTSTEVTFPGNVAAYLEYRVTFPETRDPNKAYVQLAELELPGVVLP